MYLGPANQVSWPFPHQLTRDVKRACNQRRADPVGYYARPTTHFTPYTGQLAEGIDAQPQSRRAN